MKDWATRTPRLTVQSHNLNWVKTSISAAKSSSWNVNKSLLGLQGSRAPQLLFLFPERSYKVDLKTFAQTKSRAQRLLLQQKKKKRKKKRAKHQCTCTQVQPAHLKTGNVPALSSIWLVYLFTAGPIGPRSRAVVKAFWELGERSQNKPPFPPRRTQKTALERSIEMRVPCASC